MSWIKIINYPASKGKLRKLYDRIKRPDGYVDGILLAHGLRPHSLYGHMVLYKNVLHHQDNTVEKWLLETIGVFVSLLNNCNYCVEHHFEGLKKLLNNDSRALAIRTALENSLTDPFNAAEIAVLRYVEVLTTNPALVDKTAIDTLRESGYNDGEILEINQVASYFAYANRTVLGLGVSLDNDILGLSPNDSSNPDNWHHS